MDGIAENLRTRSIMQYSKDSFLNDGETLFLSEFHKDGPADELIILYNGTLWLVGLLTAVRG